MKSIVKETKIFPNFLIIHKNISETTANNLEIKYIKRIGRIENDGTLTNMSDGGDGQSGWIMSEETKRKKSISMTGKIIGPMSSETKRKISESKKGKTHKGCKFSDESKKKMSLAKRGKYIGEKNWNYSKKMSDESKLKISKRNKGKLSGVKHPNYKNPNHINVVAKDTWELTNTNNEIIIIQSLNRFCQENSLNVSCMRDISYNRQKSHKGWIKVKKLTNNVKGRKEKTKSNF